MADQLRFVQFPHPKDELPPDRDRWKEWNVSSRHGRKFMRSVGRRRNGDSETGVEHSGDVVFWASGNHPPSYCRRTTSHLQGGLNTSMSRSGRTPNQTVSSKTPTHMCLANIFSTQTVARSNREGRALLSA